MTSPALENRRSLATEVADMGSNLHTKRATFGYVSSFAALFVWPIPTQAQLIAFCCLVAYTNGPAGTVAFS